MNIFVFSRFRKGNILFRRISEKKRKSKKKNKKKSNESHATSTLKLVEQKTDDEPASNVENEEVDRSADLDTKRKVWADLHVAEDLIRSLIEQNFTEPTPIQKLSLPAAIQDRLDVIGAAETVNFLESMRLWNRENFSCLSIKSGKRQNFSFRTSDPNSHDQHVRKRSSKNEIGSTKCSNESRWILFDLKISCGQLTCLILTPTRELAVQIKSHIELACRYTKFKVISFSIENRKTKLFVRIASLQTAVMVGGMSTQKQERLLQQKPEIIVATPGRFWELIEEVEQTKDFSFSFLHRERRTFSFSGRRTFERFNENSIFSHRRNGSNDRERSFRRIGKDSSSSQRVRKNFFFHRRSKNRTRHLFFSSFRSATMFNDKNLSSRQL